MKTGKIRYWREEKSFGFITPDDGGEHADGLFFHASGLTGDRHMIETGDRVSYDIAMDRKTLKPKAVNIAFLTSGEELPSSITKTGGGKYSHGF
jgi:cold shock protein